VANRRSERIRPRKEEKETALGKIFKDRFFDAGQASQGTTFYMQDVTGGKPLTANNTLATLVVHLQR